ncbi:MAG TPA: hypothetical protein VIR54_27095 [Vicinamibacterales bacterium]|jgi:hypothetical protein
MTIASDLISGKAFLNVSSTRRFIKGSRSSNDAKIEEGAGVQTFDSW